MEVVLADIVCSQWLVYFVYILAFGEDCWFTMMNLRATTLRQPEAETQRVHIVCNKCTIPGSRRQ